MRIAARELGCRCLRGFCTHVSLGLGLRVFATLLLLYEVGFLRVGAPRLHRGWVSCGGNPITVDVALGRDVALWRERGSGDGQRSVGFTVPIEEGNGLAVRGTAR